jgi:hypothetical protein
MSLSYGRYLKSHLNGSFHHSCKSGNICDALDTGLNESGFKGERLMNKKRCLVTVVIAAIAVLFSAPSCTTTEQPINHGPIISSLEAPERVLPSASCQIMCNASDPDGDELSYEWITTGGDISGTGPEVTWTAPEDIGICDITVVVDDGHDGEDSRSVTLNVTRGAPPTIEDLIVTAEHKYLRKSAFGYDYDVLETMEYNIDCIASDTDGEPDELVYEWSCDAGEISGEGSIINWTAPNQASVAVTVTVIVSDVAGNKADKSIDFYVLGCTCNF